MNVVSKLMCVGLAAGSSAAFAQPVVDGTLDAGQYGSILWVQNQPTGFGDNVPASGNPGAVTTGVEIAIPLSAIGNPAGSFRLAGWVNSGDRTFLSNQVIGGLPGIGNLGNPASVNFDTISGTQWTTVTPPSTSAPTVDGMLDAGFYGLPFFVQNNYTGFGNATHGNLAGGSGSEIDAVYACVNGGNLYIFIAGNLEANGNGLDLFFDTTAGGQTVLAGTNPTVPMNNGLNNMAGLGFDLSPGAAFGADYYLTISGNDPGTGFVTEVWLADLNLGNGHFLGNGGYGVIGGALTGAGVGAPTAFATINNSNTIGVLGSPGTIPSPDFANGSEIDGVYGKVQGGKLYVLLTGNLETSWNKIDLFFDVRPGGQSPLREDNVDIDFGALKRMGAGPVGNPPVQAPGLTFDAGFAADYYLNITNGGNPVQVFANAVVLRTDGPVLNPFFFPLDYGAYDGGLKSNPAVYPTPFAGPLIDPQSGFTPSIYCNYGPRKAGESVVANPAAPTGTPDLIRVAINNSNVAGVSGVNVNDPQSPFSVAGAPSVTTGIEFSIDLAELGWDNVSPIRIAGFVNNGSHDFVSNQVIGGLPNTPGFPFSQNLGEVRLVDFSMMAGDQFVVIPTTQPCYPDCNGDGLLNIADFGCFQTKFATGNMYADCNGDSLLNLADFGCFQTKFAIGCP